VDDVEKEFTLRGQRFRMRRQDFIDAVRDQRPQPLMTWAVDIGGTWYPPKQIVRAATGASQFTSHEAIAVLRRFNIEAFDATRSGGHAPTSANGVSGEIISGEDQRTPSMRLTALREAIQFVGRRPDGTVDEVLEAARKFEAWLSR
jgi:hypothetical protein